MKHIFTISLCFLALSLSAQETITYPYNPDGDADGNVAVSDLQDILGVYGNAFTPSEITIDGVELYDLLQSIISRIEALEAQQNAEEVPDFMFNQGDGTDGSFVLEPGQLDVYLPPGNYTEIYIPEGASAWIEPHMTSVIRATDSFVVEGFLNGSGSDASGGSGPYSNEVHLMSPGGGRGGGYDGSWSSNSWGCDDSSESGIVSAFNDEDFFDVNELGGQTSGSLNTTNGALRTFPYLHGGDGGTAHYWSGGNVFCGRPGGQGGGGIYVFAPVIQLTGYLWLNGGDGQGCGQSQYGSRATGGGGGGKALFCGDEILVSGEFRSDGGLGGGCSNIPPYAMTPASDGSPGELILLEW